VVIEGEVLFKYKMSITNSSTYSNWNEYEIERVGQIIIMPTCIEFEEGRSNKHR
jgi:hypothetical protein